MSGPSKNSITFHGRHMVQRSAGCPEIDTLQHRLYHNQAEDWRHVFLWPSLDAALNRSHSWSKVTKSMESWRLPHDFWITMEKGMMSYTDHPVKAKDGPLTATPFPPTSNDQRNALKLAFQAQLSVLNQPVVLNFTSRKLIEIYCMVCYNVHPAYCSYNPALYYSLLIILWVCLPDLPATSK
jgi:hypothetical protein